MEIQETYCFFGTDKHTNVRHPSVQKIPCFLKIRRSVTDHVQF